MGKQLAQEVERQAKIVDDPTVAEYVNRLGQNLVRNSDAKVPFTIKVIQSAEVNAFALPGGFFFVNSGLILKADNEAELAGVMAHEIGHVAARHGTRQATTGAIAIWHHPSDFHGRLGWLRVSVREPLAIPMSFLSFSRAWEAKPICSVLNTCTRPATIRAFIDFFEKIQSLEKKKPGTMSKVFSTHPPTDDRIKVAQENIQRYLKAKPEYVVTTSEFNDVKARLYSLENHRKMDDSKDSNRPRLRRNPNAGSGPIDDNSGDTQTEDGHRRAPNLETP